jgi:hypothetical protein
MSYTGPYYDYISVQNGRFIRKIRYRSVGKGPFRDPLPYNAAWYRGDNRDNMAGTTSPVTNYGQQPYALAWNDNPIDIGSASYAKAFDRFASSAKAGGSASMGVTIAEARSSLDMISNRATQLVAAANAIRKGNFGSLMDSLNLSRSDSRGRRVWSRRNPTASSSSQLLEYAFGWAPMVNDVRAACKVLSSDVEPLRVRASGSEKVRSFLGSQGDFPESYIHYVTDYERKQVIGAVVIVTNPNLSLASDLGLTNPIQLAWQVIPYSFLVDNFFGVSQYLGRYSAMFGRALQGGYLSGKVVVSSTSERRVFVGSTLYESSTLTESGNQFQRTPITELPIPSILPSFKLPVSNLLGRAVTTTALLLQRLK